MKRTIDTLRGLFLAFLLCGFSVSACVSGTNIDPEDCVDADEDGICDDEDLCQGDNSNGDEDGDGICDLGQTGDPLDSDGDGVPDSEDVCEGHDDNLDEDADGTPDGCDHCMDSDGDGVCDEDDLCEGHDDKIDIDENDIPDACDRCVDLPDGTFLCKEPCFDRGGDADGDNICDNDDKCLGDANPACCKIEDDCTSNQDCEYADPNDPTGICTNVFDPDATPCTRHTDCAEGEFCASLLEPADDMEETDNCYAQGEWDAPMPEGVCKPTLDKLDEYGNDTCAGQPIKAICTCDFRFVATTCELDVIGARYRMGGMCPIVECVNNEECPPNTLCIGGGMAKQCLPPTQQP